MPETDAALAYIIGMADTAVPLTVLRITTLLYMSDWRSAIQSRTQISDIHWVQPFVAKMREVHERTARALPGVSISPDGLIVRVDPRAVYHAPNLSPNALVCIDFVLRREAENGWLNFFKLAYSTFPMLSRPTMSQLDLVLLAVEYLRHPDLERVTQ